MILAVADANKVQIEATGGVNVPGCVADVHHAGGGSRGILQHLDGFIENVFAGIFVIGATGPKLFAGDTDVLHFDFGCFFPTSGGYGYVVVGVLEQLGYGLGGTGHFDIVLGVLGAVEAQVLAVASFEMSHFLGFHRTIEVLGDEVFKNGSIIYVGYLHRIQHPTRHYVGRSAIP